MERVDMSQTTPVNSSSLAIQGKSDGVSLAEQCPICGSADTSEVLRGCDRFHGRQESYQLIACGCCSLVWVQNPPSIAQIGEHYGYRYYDLVTAAAEKSSDRWRRHRATIERHMERGSI